MMARRYNLDVYDNMDDPMYEREDVYDTMTSYEREWNDRFDYANDVAAAGDPERAAEIRMGA